MLHTVAYLIIFNDFHLPGYIILYQVGYFCYQVAFSRMVQVSKLSLGIDCNLEFLPSCDLVELLC